jgi:bifunctional non-homologous end joining protein LigD
MRVLWMVVAPLKRLSRVHGMVRRPNIHQVLDVLPQLVSNRGLAGLKLAISEPERYAIEPKVDGVRGLIAFLPEGTVEARNRRGIRRDWLRGDGFEAGIRHLASRLPILWDGTVLDGELIADRFSGTMAALHGSARHRLSLRFVVFDVPYLASVDLRPLSWQDRRDRLELLAQAFEPPYELSPVVTPEPSLVERMITGALEGVVLKDRRSTYRGGSRAGWTKVKDASWYAREAWRFDRR